MKVMHVVGARPNFMKTAPIMAQMHTLPAEFNQILIHTGQHYDPNMSDQFFQDLHLPKPNEFLGIGSGTHAEQTAKIMIAFEPIVLKYRPDWVFVVGDVNSTIACAFVCAKLGIPVAHVEAGLRSGDRTMPEEINRLLTDQLAERLFTPSREADENLKREGIDPGKIHFVGNVMIDSLTQMLPTARALPTLKRLGLKPRDYVLATFHRPSNVDKPDTLHELLTAMEMISHDCPVVFPIHPRTKQHIAASHLSNPRLQLLAPLGYLDFLALTDSATVVLTDSGGIQEETTYLGVPCLTVRTTTERPITITQGTNCLVAAEHTAIVNAFHTAVGKYTQKREAPEYWDGHAAKRIVDVMRKS